MHGHNETGKNVGKQNAHVSHSENIKCIATLVKVNSAISLLHFKKKLKQKSEMSKWHQNAALSG